MLKPEKRRWVAPSFMRVSVYISDSRGFAADKAAVGDIVVADN